MLVVCLCGAALAAARAADPPCLTVSCAPDNDLLRVLQASGYSCERADSPRAAVERAAQDGAVLVLADGYPQRPTEVPAGLLEAAARRNLRLYLEFPSALPGMEIAIRGADGEASAEQLRPVGSRKIHTLSEPRAPYRTLVTRTGMQVEIIGRGGVHYLLSPTDTEATAAAIDQAIRARR